MKIFPHLSSRIRPTARLTGFLFRYSFGRIDPMALMMASAAWRSSAMSSKPSVVRIERTPSAPASSRTVLTWISVGTKGAALTLRIIGNLC